jgi:hypothetical protein
MTTIYKVSKRLWVDHSKEINPAIERSCKTTRLDDLIKASNDFDEWCKVHEEVLKDIQTSAYGEGYHDGELVGAASERGILKEKYRRLIMAASINNENPGWVQIAVIESILTPYDIIVPDIENLQEFPFRSYPKKETRPSKTDWCKNTFCPDCPDSDTCSESRK